MISWYIGTATSIRAPGIRDIRKATPHLHELLGLLTRLQVVVLMGRKAQKAWAVAAQKGQLPTVAVIESRHPSPLVLNRHPDNRARSSPP